MTIYTRMILCSILIVCLLGAIGTTLANAMSDDTWVDGGSTHLMVDASSSISAFDPRGVQLSDEFLIIGVTTRSNCGEVRIYSIDKLITQTNPQPQWVLRPDSDDSMTCDSSQRREIFGSRIAYSEDVLLISDINESDLGIVYAYEAIRNDGQVIDWVLIDRLGPDIDFGKQLFINNNAIFVVGDGGVMRSFDTVDIFNIVDSEIEFDFRYTGFFNQSSSIMIAGDQILDGSFLQNIGNGTTFPGINGDLDFSINQATRVSANRMVVPDVLPTSINIGTMRHKIFRRGQLDGWTQTQTIVSPLEDIVFPNPVFSTSSALNGSDLMINWNSVDSGDGINQLEYYHQDADGQYVLQQQLLTNRQPFGEQSAQIYMTKNRAVLLTTVLDGIDVNLFERDSGNSFIVDRGISGNWSFGPDRSGQGMLVEILGPVEQPRILVHWDTHDNEGNQMWLRGVGNIDRDRVTMDLVQAVGGEFGSDFDPNMVQRLPWGQINLIFDDCDSGVMRYNSVDFGVGEMAIHRVYGIDGLDCGDALASDVASLWTGSWSDPDFRGQGFMLQVAATSTTPVLASSWNTYDDSGNQVWLYSDLRLDESTESVFFDDVRQPVNMRFDGVLDSSDRIVIDWGQLLMTRSTCDRIELGYSALSPIFGAGQQSLRRITVPLGVRCID